MKKFLCYDTNEAARGEVPVNNQGVLIGGLGAVVTYKGEFTDDQSRIKFKASIDDIKRHYEKGNLIKLDYIDPGQEHATIYLSMAASDYSYVLMGSCGVTGMSFEYSDGWYIAARAMF